MEAAIKVTIEYKRPIHMKDVRSKQQNWTNTSYISPFSLTFPVVSLLFLGVFVFLSFFIRSAGGAKYSGGKGIFPTHMQAPNFQMTTQTGMSHLQDNKRHTQTKK